MPLQVIERDEHLKEAGSWCTGVEIASGPSTRTRIVTTGCGEKRTVGGILPVLKTAAAREREAQIGESTKTAGSKLQKLPAREVVGGGVLCAGMHG